jgi:hypothetical protein
MRAKASWRSEDLAAFIELNIHEDLHIPELRKITGLENDVIFEVRGYSATNDFEEILTNFGPFKNEKKTAEIMSELIKDLRPLTIILKQTRRISKLETPSFRVRKLRGNDFEIKEHISRDLLEETGLSTTTIFDLNVANPKIYRVRYCEKIETLEENSLYYLDNIEKIIYRGKERYMFALHDKTGMIVAN